MKITAFLSIIALFLAFALSGCGGGSPMTVQSRYETPRKPGELTLEERIQLDRQIRRSQGSGK